MKDENMPRALRFPLRLGDDDGGAVGLAQPGGGRLEFRIGGRDR